MSKYLIFLLLLFPISIQANIGGSDLQNFNPTSNGLDFITVQSSKTLDPLQFNFGSFVTYTFNSLPYSTVSNAPGNQSFSEPNDRLLYSHLHFGLGIMQGWDFGINAGFLNAQDIEQSNFLFNYGDTGIDDVRLNTKVRVYAEDDWGLALVAGIDFDQVKNNPFAGEDSGPTINIEGVADIYLSPVWLWSVNFGYRLRDSGTPIPNTGVLPLSDQVIYSSAMSYIVDDKGSAVIGELFGSYTIDSISLPTDRQTSNLEALVGYRWRAMENFDLHGGLGTELYHGLGSPDFRMFLGLNVKLGFLKDSTSKKREKWSAPDNNQPKVIQKSFSDEDGDGVRDQDDRCPDTPLGSKINGFGCEITEPNF